MHDADAADDATSLCFAYGSNLSREQVARRCPGAQPVATGVLRDHRLAFTRWSPAWQGGVADVVAAPGQSVWGLVWSLDLDGLAALDAHEGHPVNYRRNLRPVEAAGLGSVDAWVYEVVDKRNHVAPAPDYLAVVLEAATRLGLPDVHVAGIRAAAHPV